MKHPMNGPVTTTRRGLLRLGGAAAAGTALHPFLPLLSSEAEAAGFPRRLLLFYMPLGTYYQNWRPTGTESAFMLSAALAPLEPYKSKIIVLDGIDNVAVSGGPGKRGHPGVNAVFTGAPHAVGSFGSGGASGFGWPTGPSIDQFIGGELAKKEALLLNSIETGFNLDGSYQSRVSFKGANQPVPPIADPQLVYKNVFADLKLGPARLEALQASRRSVIDTVSADIQRVRAKLPSADRPKLDAHLQNLRVIEGKLSVAVGSCNSVPAAPPRTVDIPATMNSHMDLITSAFACNLTRVASILGGREGFALGKPGFLVGVTDSHHPLSHRTDAAGYEMLTKVSAWYYGQMKLMMDKLAAVKEGDGTMLDNTVIVAASPMGEPAKHNIRGMPVVLGGSCGGAFRTGRYLKFGNYVNGTTKDNDHGGQPMNNLLVSLSIAMGVPIDSFGDKRFCTGPLPRLT